MDMTHRDLGILLGLGLEGLLASGQPTGGGGKSATSDEGSHFCLDYAGGSGGGVNRSWLTAGMKLSSDGTTFVKTKLEAWHVLPKRK